MCLIYLAIRAATATTGAALQAVAAAAHLAFVMNLVIQQIPHVQPDNSKYDNRNNHRRHKLPPFLLRIFM